MFEAIARFSVRFRWLILIFWIVAVPILVHHLPTLDSVAKNNTTQFLPKSSPFNKAIALESSFEGKNSAGTATIVAYRPSGLTAADTAALTRLQARVKHVHGVNDVINQGQSADGQADQMQVVIGSSALAGNAANNIIAGIRDQWKSGMPAGLQLHLTGQFAEDVDSTNANNNGRNNTELYTAIFIIVLLLLVFRALLAPIITLVPAGLALVIAQPIIAESTKIGVQVSFLTQILLIVLLLGAGTDYGLFLVFRVREELRNGHEPKEAVVRALTRVGESITFSAATVVAALLSLLLASFGIYKGLGPGLAIGLGVMLLIGLTFLPALLAVLGQAVFWPSRTRNRPNNIGLWGRLADRVIKRPVVMLVIGVAIFGGLAFGIIGYQTTGFTDESSPAGSDSAIGQQIITKHFPAANNNPQLLIFKFNKPVWNSGELSAVQQAQHLLAASSRFKAVSGPFNANGFRLTPASLQHLHATDPSSPALQAASQFISHDGRTVQFYAISSAGAEGTPASMNATPGNRAAVARVARRVGAADNAIYSQDAGGYDIDKVATSDLVHIIPIVLIIIAVLLALMLRSLVAPWYLILTVALSYFGSLGFAMIVFVHLGGQPGLNFILPFLMFIFCMALGEDYNILMMSRIREESHNHPSTRQAVTQAIGVTGTTVTSAGLILAGTFGVLGLVGGSAQIQQIGFSVAFGILLDTFFVRTLLVPSIVVLLGRRNWWPSRLYRDSKS